VIFGVFILFYFVLFCFVLLFKSVALLFLLNLVQYFGGLSNLCFWYFCDFVLCDGHFPRFCDLLCEIAIGGAGSLCLGVLILGVAGSQGKLVPATMSRSMETNPTKRGICEEEKGFGIGLHRKWGICEEEKVSSGEEVLDQSRPEPSSIAMAVWSS
jgi:hypothetical protein